MKLDVGQILLECRLEGGPNGAFAQIDAAGDEPAAILAFVRELQQARTELAPPTVRTALIGRTARALSRHAGRAQAEAILALAEVDASLVAWVNAQPAEVFLAMLQEPRDGLAAEAMMQWLHELIGRGVDLDRREVRAWVDRHRDHRFAGLPLALASSASAVDPRAGAASQAGLVLHEQPAPPALAGLPRSAEVSNGKVEARLFAVSPPAAGLDEALLRRAGLACLVDAVRVELCPLSAEQAWEKIVSLARDGGAYGCSSTHGDAVLRAWPALAGFLDRPADRPLAEVRAAAGDAAWVAFISDSTWFFDVAWDVGQACLNRDGTRLAVLAATDTD